ncbi:MAG: SUF system NifU family Fe-S cluster assembly protein, partial [Leptospira sp.]|nr:SUF system NifU family Fe-S cluster assembly protein [Leptospira sp.]
FINLDGGRISEVRFNGKGCSISQASASMMTEAILGKTVNEAESIIGKFKSMIIDDKDPMFGEELEDIASLEGVKKFPVRVKCALLSWNTLEKALKS